MKKILLTGSSSFLGSKFIELYKNEFDILGISKHDSIHPVDMVDFETLKKIYLNFQPDVIIHTASILYQTTNDDTNVRGTQYMVDLAKLDNIPLIFTSSETVYGGNEHTGEYVETDPYKPRSLYGETKAESEKIIIASGLSYLITRCHRYVGVNKNFHKPKQFPDTIKTISQNQEVHCDSHRLFKPCLINHISEIFAYYIENDSDKKVLINLGVDKTVTYYDFIVDVAKTLGFNIKLIKPDGEENGWLENNALSIKKMKELGYPPLPYSKLLETLKNDWSG